jgi:hypothetical protein
MTWPRRAIIVSIAGLALVICAGATMGVGVFVRRALGTGPCKPPSYEPALITAYRAEPVLTVGITSQPTEEPAIQHVPQLTAGASQPSDQPDIRHFCDTVGVDHIHPLSYSEVTYRYRQAIGIACPIFWPCTSRALRPRAGSTRATGTTT